MRGFYQSDVINMNYPGENTIVEVETVQTKIATMHSLWVAKTFCYNFIISVEERKMNENYSKGASRIPKKKKRKPCICAPNMMQYTLSMSQ